jgi:hypothetical protein
MIELLEWRLESGKGDYRGGADEINRLDVLEIPIPFSFS